MQSSLCFMTEINTEWNFMQEKERNLKNCMTEEV